MNEVLIVCREAPISRMLFLEAERRGKRAAVSQTLEEPCTSEVVIADYDGLTDAEKQRCTTPAGMSGYLLFGCGEIPASAGAYRFPRPFSVQAIFEAVEALTSGKWEGSAALPFPRLSLTAAGICLGESPLSLTKREEAILTCLLSYRGETVPRAALIAQVWGEEQASSNALEVYIGHLRRKIEAAGGARPIRAVHGVGYRVD